MTTQDPISHSDPSPPIPLETVAGTVTPLRQIFWGGLLCVLDLRINGFDILNDVLGMILITAGVFRLAAVPLTPSYARGMNFVKLVAVLATFRTFVNQFRIEKPPAIQIVWSLSGLIDLGAILVFLASMNLFCTCARLEGPAASWKTTRVLFFVLYALPLGFLHVAHVMAVATHSSFNLDLGPAAVLLILPLLIPLIHLFVSTSRMRRAASGWA